MKIYMEFHLATWLRIVNFAELKISEFLFWNDFYISYDWKSFKNLKTSGI